MEKKLKIVKLVAIIAVIILVCAIAFCGNYKKDAGIWKDTLPKFKYGMELDGTRELRFTLNTDAETKSVYLDENGKICGTVNNGDQTEGITVGEPATITENEDADKITSENEIKINENKAKYAIEAREVKANPDEEITIDNINESKKIIQKRIETLKSYEYNIRQDTVTGDIIIEVPDDENIPAIKSFVTAPGKLTMVDHESGLELISYEHVKKTTAVSNREEDGSLMVYLQVEYDKEGQAILAEISELYQQVTLPDGTTDQFNVTMLMDNEAVVSTYFGAKMENGMLTIPLGESYTDTNQFVQAFENAQSLAEIINNKVLPLEYKLVSDNLVLSNVSENCRLGAIVVFAFAVVLASLIMIAKYKVKGLLYAVYSVGYIAIFSLIIRYTNVYVTINSAIAFVAAVVINYAFVFKILPRLKDNFYDNRSALGLTLKELYLAIIPVCLIAVICTFMNAVIISSVGMTLFWGLLLQAVYSLIVLL